MSQPSPSHPLRCPDCGAEVGPSQLACPACQRLVHSDRLRELAALASEAEKVGDKPQAIALWREALTLLPPQAQQARAIRERIVPLAEETPAGGSSRLPAYLGALGVVGLLVWKFKFLLVLLLTKGKLLLLGLTKAPTLFSMFITAQLFVREYGWPFVAGVLLSVYVHEMGHVYRLRRLGLAQDDPVFIPGVGAFVLMKDLHISPREDARVGLAGPWWGLAACLATLILYALTRADMLLAVCVASAWLNLLNLLPIWYLDGSRGLRPLSRGQILLLCALGLGLFALHALFALAFLGLALWKAFRARERGDWKTFADFAFLLVSLGLLTQVRWVLTGS